MIRLVIVGAFVGAIVGLTVLGVQAVSDRHQARSTCLRAGYMDYKEISGWTIRREFFCVRKEQGSDVVVPIENVRP